MTEIDTFTPRCRRQLARFYADEDAATAIEYAMIASGIGVVIVTIVYTLGGKVKDLFSAVSGAYGT